MNTFDPEIKETNDSPVNIIFDDTTNIELYHRDSDIIVLDNVLTELECVQIKKIIDSSSNETNNKNRKKACIKFSTLSDIVSSRCTDYLPKSVYTKLPEIKNGHNTDHNYWNYDEINPNWRLVKCIQNSAMSPHYDAVYVKSVDYKSLYTVMLYLSNNDDGATHFSKQNLSVLPKAGRLLIFNQNLLHYGMSNVIDDKYFIRSEIMYLRYKSIATQSDIKAMELYNMAKNLYYLDPSNSLELETEAFKLSPLLEDTVLGLN
jgi:hypothetical protein